MPKWMQDVVVLKSHGSRVIVSTSNDFKVKVYFSILDSIISKIHKQFDGKNISLMKAAHSCIPFSPEFLDMSRLLPMVEQHTFLDKDLLAMECTLAKHTLAGKDHL